MNHGLQLGNVGLSSIDTWVSLFDLLDSKVETLLNLSSSLNKTHSFVLKNSNSASLGVALVLNLWKRSSGLVNGLLVLLTKIVLLIDALAKVFFLTLKLLVASGELSYFRAELDNGSFSGGDLLLDSHGLLRDFIGLVGLVSVLGFEQLEFLSHIGDQTLLVVDLRFIISLKGVDAHVHGLLSSSEILDNWPESWEVSTQVFVRLNFSSVSSNNLLSDSCAHSGDLAAFAMLILNLLVFGGFSLLSLLSVLLIHGVRLSVSYIDLDFWLKDFDSSSHNLLPEWGLGSLGLDILILDWLRVVLLTDWAKILLLIGVTSIRSSGSLVRTRGSVWLNSTSGVSSWAWALNVSSSLSLTPVLSLESELSMEVVRALISSGPPVDEVLIVLSNVWVFVKIVCNDQNGLVVILDFLIVGDFFLDVLRQSNSLCLYYGVSWALSHVILNNNGGLSWSLWLLCWSCAHTV